MPLHMKGRADEDMLFFAELFPDASECDATAVTQSLERARAERAAEEHVLTLRLYVAALNEGSTPLASAAVYNEVADFLIEVGRFDWAIACFLRAREILKNQGVPGAEARLLANIGGLYEREGRWADAEAYYALAHESFQRLRLRREEDATATALNNVRVARQQFGGEADLSGPTGAEAMLRLAELHLEAQNPEGALEILDDARDMVMSSQLHALMLNTEGRAYLAMREPAVAAQRFQSAGEIAEKTGDLGLLGSFLNNLGEALRAMNDFMRAKEAYQRSLEVKKGRSHPGKEAATRYNLAQLHLALGELDAAQENLDKAIALDQIYNPDELERDRRLNNEIALAASRQQELSD